MTNDAKLSEIQCVNVPPPGGHYAQGVLHGNTLYVSGQLGVTGNTVNAADVPIGEQVVFALSNIERIAGAAGAKRSDVVKCTVFVTGIEYWEEANRAYAAFFGEHKPARSIISCLPLHFGAKVEIEAVVAIGG